jgi:UDP-N-acetylmuramyl pentapeptide synthase
MLLCACPASELSPVRPAASTTPPPATTLNDENILVLGDLEETNPTAEAAQRQVAAYALTEINRIIIDLSDPV